MFSRARRAPCPGNAATCDVEFQVVASRERRVLFDVNDFDESFRSVGLGRQAARGEHVGGHEQLVPAGCPFALIRICGCPARRSGVPGPDRGYGWGPPVNVLKREESDAADHRCL
jgi:hypothetical protein